MGNLRDPNQTDPTMIMTDSAFHVTSAQFLRLLSFEQECSLRRAFSSSFGKSLTSSPARGKSVALTGRFFPLGAAGLPTYLRLTNSGIVSHYTTQHP